MQQHMEALKKANDVRLARVALLRGMKRGELKLAQVLAEDVMENVKLYDVLRWIPVNGPATGANPTGSAVKTAQVLVRHCEATFTTTVLGLGARRLNLLLKEVDKRWGGRV